MLRLNPHTEQGLINSLGFTAPNLDLCHISAKTRMLFCQHLHRLQSLSLPLSSFSVFWTVERILGDWERGLERAGHCGKARVS
jgi:hypothetical protein